VETINVHAAKTHLSQLLERVAQGETVVIAKAGKPVAVLSPYVPVAAARRPGSLKGRIHLADDFDADDGAIAALFEGCHGPD